MMRKFVCYIKKDIKIIAVSALCGLLLTTVLAVRAYAKRVSGDISGAVIRFHVLANSDEDFDQSLKLDVRDGILEYLSEDMQKCESRDDAEKYLSAKTAEIAKLAEKIIEAEGYSYDVKAELSDEHYPVRYYGSAVFPEGDYLSLRVTIGEGEGHNWWCVMYPPLCLNGEGIACADTDMLKDVLTDESYEVVVLSADNAVPEMKFKIVEWWNSVAG
ncbi:MAG: stage II sporulation protein R [Clostridiales bacterium]|nr:stage II sporulation protein R [Clostridiales bacterium]